MEHELLPFDIVNQVLESCADTELLKIGRLVSKSWNQICCRYLRKESTVSLKQVEHKGQTVEKFKSVLLDHQENFPPEWPNPFQNLKILKASFTDPNLVKFIQNTNLNITTLDVVYDWKLNPTIFASVLEQHKDTLINFSILGTSQGLSFLSLQGKLKSSWKSLKSVTLRDFCSESSPSCSHIYFVRALVAINEGRIKELRLHLHLPKVGTILSQSRGCWRMLTHLDIRSGSVLATPESIRSFMAWGKEIELPSLTHLSVWFPPDSNAALTGMEYSLHILPLVHKSSMRLKSLESPLLSARSLPPCPKLAHLRCPVFEGNPIQDINELKFSSLSSVSLTVFWMNVPPPSGSAYIAANNTVETLTLFWEESSVRAALDAILSCLVSHFPNLKDVSILPHGARPAVSPALGNLVRLLDVVRMMPRWQKPAGSTELPDTSRSFSSGSGPSCLSMPANTFYSPLTQLTELTHLRLGESVKVTPAAVADLGKLAKIKFLSFHWNTALNAAAVVKCLEHVDSIVIKYRNNQEIQELISLAASAKNLKLIELNAS